MNPAGAAWRIRAEIDHRALTAEPMIGALLPLIAAKLNVANGASNVDVQMYIDDGDALIGDLTAAEVAAYDAPFPSERYKQAARAFPRLVPTEPDDPAIPANRAAWAALGSWEKPFLTAFGKKDPILGWADKLLQRHVPGTRGQPHRPLPHAGHFLQEEVPADLAAAIFKVIE